MEPENKSSAPNLTERHMAETHEKVHYSADPEFFLSVFRKLRHKAQIEIMPEPPRGKYVRLKEVISIRKAL